MRQKLPLKMAFSVSYCRKDLLLRCCRHSGSFYYGSILQNVIPIWRKQPPKLIQCSYKVIIKLLNRKYFSIRGSRTPFNISDGPLLDRIQQLLGIKYCKFCIVCWWCSSMNLCYDISQEVTFYSGESEM